MSAFILLSRLNLIFHAGYVIDQSLIHLAFIAMISFLRTHIFPATYGREHHFTEDQLLTAGSPVIRRLMHNRTITLAQALTFKAEQRATFENPVILDLIASATITVEEAMQLDRTARASLELQGVRDLLAADYITLADILRFDGWDFQTFSSQHVIDLITTNTISFSTALRNGYDISQTFDMPAIRDLIDDQTIRVEDAILFGHQQRVALSDEQTRQRLRNHELTIEDIMGVQAPPLNPPIAAAPDINNAQSTHTASVHQTVSESANRLADRYGEMIDGAGLENTLAQLQDYVSGLPDTLENMPAKRCMLRLASPDYVFTDPSSQVTTRQLLALSFLAINDDTQRQGSLEDARAQFVQGLCEIQRGYNLSDSGVDQGGDDVPICAGGTFNKLMEKLQGIHPDCQVHFMTKKTAALKLPNVVREEARRYLTTQSQSESDAGKLACAQLIGRVTAGGVGEIWEQIRNAVAVRMYDEFGSLYPSNTHASFTEMIDAGQYADLGDLTTFQPVLQ